MQHVHDGLHLPYRQKRHPRQILVQNSDPKGEINALAATRLPDCRYSPRPSSWPHIQSDTNASAKTRVLKFILPTFLTYKLFGYIVKTASYFPYCPKICDLGSGYGAWCRNKKFCVGFIGLLNFIRRSEECDIRVLNRKRCRAIRAVSP